MSDEQDDLAVDFMADLAAVETTDQGPRLSKLSTGLLSALNVFGDNEFTRCQESCLSRIYVNQALVVRAGVSRYIDRG